MTKSLLRIATRSSPLALWQANHVADLLRAAVPGMSIELVPVSTSGDQNRVDPLSQMGGQGVFTREVQFAVLDGRADLAVHSLKDLPTITAQGLCLAATPVRESRWDVLVLPRGRECHSLADLPPAAILGTGSLRRRSQLLQHRPDLRFDEARGNLDTRLRKLDEGQFDGLLLAEAGLRRLGLGDRIGLILQPPLLYPAVGQAAIGIECRADDERTISWLSLITDAETQAEVTAERACLAELRAGCHAPVGAWARLERKSDAAVTPNPDDLGILTMDAVVLSPDGTQRIMATSSGPATSAFDVGRVCAELLRKHGAAELL